MHPGRQARVRVDIGASRGTGVRDAPGAMSRTADLWHPRGMMRNLTFRKIGVAAVVGLLAVVVIQNAATVEIGFLGWGIRLPGIVLHVLVFGGGFLAGWFAHGVRRSQSD
jgi:uncharacterized integral membrane protein